MTRYATRECSCEVPRLYGGQKRPVECIHGNRFLTDAQLNPPERTPLRKVSLKRQGEEESGKRRRTGSTLKAGRGFSAAPAQQAKVKLLTCLGCGREVDPDEPGDWSIDAAHLVPRSGGGCDSPDCVLPLCRHRYQPFVGCHPTFDGKVPGKSIDLHSRLAQGGYEKELAHAVGVHGLTPLELVRRVTGEPYVPQRELELATARIVELEARIAA